MDKTFLKLYVLNTLSETKIRNFSVHLSERIRIPSLQYGKFGLSEEMVNSGF